jgi:hypothetical protein
MGIGKSPRRRFCALAFIALFAAGLIRYRVHYDSTDLVPREPESFRLAHNLAETGQFANPFVPLDTGPSAHMAPAFPALLALTMKVFGDKATGIYAIKWAAAILLSIEVALFPVFSSALGMGELNGVVAAAIWIVTKVGLEFPLGHQRAVMFSWEAFYAAAFVALTLCCCRRYLDSPAPAAKRLAWLIGILLGGMALTCPAAGIIFLGWAAWVAWRDRLAVFRQTHLIVVLLPVLIVAPWIVRNYMVFGRLVFVRDNFGLELSVSNNDCAMFGSVQNRDSGCFGKVHPNASVDEARKVLIYGEANYDELKLREAESWIESHAAQFFKLTALRFAAFWLPPATDGPFSLVGRGRRTERLVTYIMTFLSVQGLFILFRRDSKSAILCAMCFILFPLVYYVVQSDYRYRYPILWFTFLLGSLPITDLVKHILRSRGLSYFAAN